MNTAVEWLENEYNTKGKLTPVDFFQAKEIEKQEKERQQKIDFANKYVDSDCIYCSGEFAIEKRADEYYDEIFKK